VSRHGRRGTQGDQDDQWGPGQWGPAEDLPPDADEPYAPGNYGQARGNWGPNPIATADTGDFPVAGASRPPVSYPRDPGGRRAEDFDWGPDPLGLDTRGQDARGQDARGSQPRGSDAQGSGGRGYDGRGYDAPGYDDQPSPEPMAPDRWAPQSWEPPSWDRASWDSETAGAASWLNPPGAGQDWAGHGGPGGNPRGVAPGGFDDLQAGELPPLPPGPRPGSGHPSGPLPPLPDSDYQWGEPPAGPLPPPGAPSRRPGGDQDQPRRPARRGGPPAGSGTGPAGYQAGPAGYPGDGAEYPGDGAEYLGDGAEYLGDGAGYRDNPDAYHPDQDEPEEYPTPRGRGRRRRGKAPEVGRGHPGYEGYVDDPRDLDMAPDQGQEPQDYAPSGSWYPGDDEPHGWAEDGHDSGLLPGLNQGAGARGGDGGGPAGPARKARKGRKRVRVILLALLAAFVVFVAVVGGVGYHYYREYINPPDFPGAGSGNVVVQIQSGQAASVIGVTLASKGVVASARAFSNAAKANPRGNALEPGYYAVHKHMKASLALALLLSPSARLQSRITIPEGFRVAQIIALLGKQTGNLKGYEQAIAHPAGLGLPAFANGKPEGYLFPATYDVQPHTSPTAVLKLMVTKFNQNAQSIGLSAASARAQETQAAVITVASLIEAEGKRPADYPKIAEVIYNRLNAKPQIRLELDTTVLYAMSLAHKNGFSTSFPSPYNTYMHAGLPPGPIDNPGNMAIHAALHPDHGNFLFFLTVNSQSGKTLFFSTSTAFNNAVAQYGSTGGGTGSRTGSG
jgi:UPF0755 protein